MFEALAIVGVHGYMGLLANKGPEFLEPRIDGVMMMLTGQRRRVDAGMAGIVNGIVNGGYEGYRRSKET